MKRTIISLIFAVVVAAFSNNASAQIEKGNIMVGGNLGNLNLGLESGSTTSFTLNPKVGWFLQDGLVVGVDASLGYLHPGGGDDVFNYGIGGFGRYYITDAKIEVIKRTKFFVEANAGINGRNAEGGSNTNGLGFGFGPGISYFLTKNVGLEAVAKYNGIVGFGSEAYQNDLTLSIGFQIYLPLQAIKSRAKSDF